MAAPVVDKHTVTPFPCAARRVPGLPESLPLVVLDTNVVLDWLVFRHPCSEVLEQQLCAGRTRWIASTAMHGELSHVLARGILDRWQPDPARIDAAWQRHALLLPAADAPAAVRLRCTDADDQKFIDFALAYGAALLSRDRAVLKLARRGRSVGLEILTPERWLQDQPPL